MGASGAPATAREALALWRGPPLSDVADEPFAAAEIRRLEELWLGAPSSRRRRSGRRAPPRGRRPARRLVAEHPLRERLHAQRMLALYRSGRQADALEAYPEARRTLVEQVGVEPGPELRRLHGRSSPGPIARDRRFGPALPRELDTESSLLIGRASRFSAWLRTAWRDAPTPAPGGLVAGARRPAGDRQDAAGSRAGRRAADAQGAAGYRYAGAASPPGAAGAAGAEGDAGTHAGRCWPWSTTSIALEPAAFRCPRASRARAPAPRGSVLVLATCRGGDRARGLEPSSAGSAWVARLATLAADDVEHIARLYEATRPQVTGRHACSRRARACRCASTSRRAEWARGIAARPGLRSSRSGRRPAARRPACRRGPSWPAASSTLQAVRERA